MLQLEVRTRMLVLKNDGKLSRTHMCACHAWSLARSFNSARFPGIILQLRIVMQRSKYNVAVNLICSGSYICFLFVCIHNNCK
jgi:hypothetical protein